jgi:hypothetical protein
VPRKHTPCRCNDLEARLQRVEELASSNRRELDIQFRRIADLQAALDSPMADGRRRKSDVKPDGQPDGKANKKADGKGKWFWPGGDSLR